MKKKRWAAVFAALMLSILLCCTTVSAQETEPDTDTAVSETENEEFHVPLFDQLESGNKMSQMLFLGGGALILVGVAGLIFVICWHRAYKRRDRWEEDREDIFDEIKQAELRNKNNKNHKQTQDGVHAQSGRETLPYSEEAQALHPEKMYGTAEKPLVPSTPVSMQPSAAPRNRVQKASGTAVPVHPIQPTVKPRPVSEKPAVPTAKPRPVSEKPAVPTAKPRSVSEKPAVPTAKPRPVSEKPVVPTAKAVPSAAPKKTQKYDLDDILREVRENNAKK